MIVYEKIPIPIHDHSTIRRMLRCSQHPVSLYGGRMWYVLNVVQCGSEFIPVCQICTAWCDYSDTLKNNCCGITCTLCIIQGCMGRISMMCLSMSILLFQWLSTGSCSIACNRDRSFRLSGTHTPIYQSGSSGQ